jgi:sporulation protein YlmC with PRC-barrel domain
MSISKEEVDRIATGGGEVRTAAGDKIGKVGQVYLDDTSGRPSWVTVKTGLFGTQESFVPLGGATISGADVVVPYDKDTIKGAPRVDTDGSLTPQEENLLYSYYGGAEQIDTRAVTEDTRGDVDDRNDRDDRDDREDRDDRTDQDDRRSRSEEGSSGDLGGAVGTERLRKYVVTEKVVPVSSEEVPIDDDSRR